MRGGIKANHAGAVVRAIGRLCDGSQYGSCEYSRTNFTQWERRRVIDSTSSSRLSLSININRAKDPYTLQVSEKD